MAMSKQPDTGLRYWIFLKCMSKKDNLDYIMDNAIALMLNFFSGIMIF